MRGNSYTEQQYDSAGEILSPSEDQSELSQSELGHSEFGQSELGQSEFGQSELGQSQFGQSELGQSEFGGYVDQEGNPNPRYISSGNSDGQRKESAISSQRVVSQRRLELWIDFISDLSFLFGTLMYLWLTLSENKDILLEMEDFEDSDGETKVGLFHQDILIASGVTLYMLYGIVSGVLILATGAFHVYTTKSLSDRIPYVFMVIASILLIASTSLVQVNSFWSNTCFSVSIHLFALQAATLLLWRISNLQSSSRRKRKGVCVRILGDILFLAAALSGITLSYLHLFEATDVLAFSHKYLAVGAAFAWWLSSVVYLLQTSFELACRGKANEEGDDSNPRGVGHQKSLPQEGTQSTDEVVQKTSSEEEVIKAVQKKMASRVYAQDPESHVERKEESDISYLHHHDEEKSAYSNWTAGSGPANKDLITKSSLDAIFGVGY